MEYYIAFWNVENLFDVVNSPRRSDKLQRTLGRELSGWTEALPHVGMVVVGPGHHGQIHQAFDDGPERGGQVREHRGQAIDNGAFEARVHQYGASRLQCPDQRLGQRPQGWFAGQVEKLGMFQHAGRALDVA